MGKSWKPLGFPPEPSLLHPRIVESCKVTSVLAKCWSEPWKNLRVFASKDTFLKRGNITKSMIYAFLGYNIYIYTTLYNTWCIRGNDPSILPKKISSPFPDQRRSPRPSGPDSQNLQRSSPSRPDQVAGIGHGPPIFFGAWYSRHRRLKWTIFSRPIGSMYAIYGNIYHQYTPNVSIYTIHGSYGRMVE